MYMDMDMYMYMYKYVYVCVSIYIYVNINICKTLLYTCKIHMYVGCKLTVEAHLRNLMQICFLFFTELPKVQSAQCSVMRRCGNAFADTA